MAYDRRRVELERAIAERNRIAAEKKKVAQETKKAANKAAAELKKADKDCLNIGNRYVAACNKYQGSAWPGPITTRKPKPPPAAQG